MIITSLKPHQVFVFGSNSTGFHGAGAAGMAWRGDSSNTWRTDAKFNAALEASVGSPLRVGKWAVLGIARGLMRGTDGMSFAVETIKRPKMRRSIPLGVIQTQFKDLVRAALLHPEYEFLMTDIGVGYAGFTAAEMITCMRLAIEADSACPGNIARAGTIFAEVI